MGFLIVPVRLSAVIFTRQKLKARDPPVLTSLCLLHSYTTNTQDAVNI